MTQAKSVRRRPHISPHTKRPYRLRAFEKVLLWIAVPALLVFVAFWYAGTQGGFSFSLAATSAQGVLESFARILIAYAFALVGGVALALAAFSYPFIGRVLVPLYDVLESVPVLAFFPTIIAVFASLNSPNVASVFVIFIAMLWNVVFAVIGGLNAIPQDIRFLGKAFRLSRFQEFRQITLPALAPSAVTGSLLAWAQAWNILIVAEVLSDYVPAGSKISDVHGIGALIVLASRGGQTALFTYSIAVLVLAIIVLNVFVWQRLLRWSRVFTFD